MLFPLVLLSLIFQTESIANTNTPVLVNLHHPNFTISLCQGLSFLIIVISSFTRICISGKRTCILIIELLFSIDEVGKISALHGWPIGKYWVQEATNKHLDYALHWEGKIITFASFGMVPTDNRSQKAKQVQEHPRRQLWSRHSATSR